eukprot:Gb_05465 [translate_table: standard]
MTRRCSHCGHNGHNSRTCPDRGVKLFGVRLTTEGLMRKSVSMGNLSHYTAASSNNPLLTPEQSESGAADDGYVSDGLIQTSNARERKKGVPWTEEEHKMFLVGLQKLGKGDWRGISRNFVTSRTPTQVASHAQKYFLRQSSLNKRKRRSSLFDISTDTVEDSHQRIPELPPAMHDPSLGQSSSLISANFYERGMPPNLTVGTFSVPSLAASLVTPPCLSLGRSRIEKPDYEKMAEDEAKYSYLKMVECTESGQYSNAMSHHYSFPLPLWPDLATNASNGIEPSATMSPVVESEDSLENSGLHLSIAPPCVDPPPPHSRKLDQSSRHSAFHSNNLSSNSSAISVV